MHKLHVHLAMHARQGGTWAVNRGQTNLRWKPTNPTKCKTPQTGIGYHESRQAYSDRRATDRTNPATVGMHFYSKEMAQAITVEVYLSLSALS